MIRINIADDFSRTPGARYPSEGPYSGQEFREKILIPLYTEAVQNGQELLVDLDGCYGYATSFLEESFGGMVRKLKVKGILNNISIISDEDPSLMKLIKNYVEEAEISL